jgi:hypothetical protein
MVSLEALIHILLLSSGYKPLKAFTTHTRQPKAFCVNRGYRRVTCNIPLCVAGATGAEGSSPTSIVPPRFPTSVEDQIRQATEAICAAEADGFTRHNVRLLLPLIGATELDDWPGGVPQQRDAASPLVSDVLRQIERKREGEAGASSLTVQESYMEGDNDGVRVILGQSTVQAKNDACAVLLPSAEVVSQIQNLDTQVGLKRNMILVNAQYRRLSDFGNALGGFFTREKNNKQVAYLEETFLPTFICTSFMVEGEQIRILRSYPGPWRVFKLEMGEEIGSISWVQIGTKDVISAVDKAADEGNQNGMLFSFGQPSYLEIEDMITSQEGYSQRSLSERAANAFTFIKDTL